MTWLSSSYDNQPGWAGLDFVSSSSHLYFKEKNYINYENTYAVGTRQKTSSSWISQKTSLPQLAQQNDDVNKYRTNNLSSKSTCRIHSLDKNTNELKH